MKRGAIAELMFPFVVVGMLSSMVLPVPPALLDVLLIGNLLFALVLLITALYVTEPIKLSALPTIILLATLYRLSLNVATTRMILGSGGGDVGQAIIAFGSAVTHGNLVVGAVVFIVITLVQFIVIAKGSERVAEVSARFTLDALPGKQMSIDADVRAGLMDFESARRKRQEVQTESRFYGALDGAMKFVKGDAIAGIIIVLVNLFGGFLLGMFVEGLDFASSMAKYSLLSIGDGLLAQIPALLNSLAAGMIVTRVVTGEDQSLAVEIPRQLGQLSSVKLIIAIISLGIAFAPGMPSWPPLILSLILFGTVFLRPSQKKSTSSATPVRFEPRIPPPIQLVIGDQVAVRLSKEQNLQEQVEQFRLRMHEQWGIIVPMPELQRRPPEQQSNSNVYEVILKGVPAFSAEARDESPLFPIILEKLGELVAKRRVELIDDIQTRRILDHYERIAPEVVSAVVPDVASVTQLTELLRGLASEGISIRHFDTIMQSVAENGRRQPGLRNLLREVRCALGRVIVWSFAKNGEIGAYILHPLVDFEIAAVERGDRPLDPALSTLLSCFFAEEAVTNVPLVTSKDARLFTRECLKASGLDVSVLAYEEIPPEVALKRLAVVGGDGSLQAQLLERLAA